MTKDIGKALAVVSAERDDAVGIEEEAYDKEKARHDTASAQWVGSS